jgi:hypothetical protein
MPTHQASRIIVTVYDKGTVMQDANPLCTLIDYKCKISNEIIKVSPASYLQQNIPILLFIRLAIAVGPAAAARSAASWLCFLVCVVHSALEAGCTSAGLAMHLPSFNPSQVG